MSGNNNGVEEISEKEFSEIISNKLVLIDFFAEWCTPCIMMGPVIEELAERMKNVKFAKVNVDENSGLSGKFKVMSIPTMIIFKEGKEVERIIGGQQADVIEEKLKKHMK
ncbi:MAG: thioredoxin [Nanoarchaeota archaeon]|nr:thioredoxin [Nanoarchaeota archaeon]MBU4086752.1 thioredoxin [Nanoarchaeota archaeon]